jgi:hypothetical protein
LALALCYPLARLFWFESHELFDYVSRTVEYAQALRHGELYPRWSASFYGGFGSPFFNFYAPMVYALGGAGTLLFGSPTLALKAVIVLASLLAGLGTFALVRLETRRSDAALLAAGLYLAAPYRLADLSWRGDLAELLALGILPVALYAYRRIAHEPEHALLPRRVLFAVIAHAALVLSHTILALWGTGLIAVVVLASCAHALKSKRPARAWLFVQAFVCALLASAIYTLPALLEKPFVRTETMTQRETATLNNFIGVPKLFDDGPMAIGPWLVFATLCTLLALYVARKRALLAATTWLAALALAALVLPSTEPIWKSGLIPFADYIQFPWRLLGPAALCASVACGLGWALVLPSQTHLPRLLAPLLALCTVAGALTLSAARVPLHPMDVDKVMLSSERIQSRWIRGTSFDEYLPKVVKNTSSKHVRSVLPRTDGVKTELVHSAGARHALTLNLTAPKDIELNLHAFPGWAVHTRQGPARVTLDTSPEGLVRLRFPTSGRYVLDVVFGATPVRKLAVSISLLGLFAAYPLALLVLRTRRRVLHTTFAAEPALHEASA